MDRPSLDICLTTEQTADLQALADALGVAPEVAAAQAIKAALDAQFLLPARTPGAVCPIRPETGPETWRRLV